MKLLIDIGNTFIKSAVFSDENTILYRNKILCSDLSAFEGVLTEIAAVATPVQATIVNVGAAKLLTNIKKYIKKAWDIKLVHFKTAAYSAGVTNAYPNPVELGADRWAALIGAHHRYETAIMIVDCGTAVTLDIIAADGQHQGGYIMPGLRMMRQALKQGTNALPDAEGDSTALADNTQDAIASGTLVSLITAVEGIYQQYKADMADIVLVLTGGDADKVAAHISLPYEHNPDLIFYGLYESK